MSSHTGLTYCLASVTPLAMVPASRRYVSATSNLPPFSTSPVAALTAPMSTTLKYRWLLSSAATGTLIFPKSFGASPTPANAAMTTGT